MLTLFIQFVLYFCCTLISCKYQCTKYLIMYLMIDLALNRLIYILTKVNLFELMFICLSVPFKCRFYQGCEYRSHWSFHFRILKKFLKSNYLKTISFWNRTSPFSHPNLNHLLIFLISYRRYLTVTNLMNKGFLIGTLQLYNGIFVFKSVSNFNSCKNLINWKISWDCTLFEPQFNENIAAFMHLWRFFPWFLIK